LLLFILVAGLIGATCGFALLLPFGWLAAFAASVTGGAIAIVLAGSWLAFVQHRNDAR
jgi:hypothetical protein